ncbi:ImmA/IrrE family metallo-endopeptidase [Bacillus amyloliquefaciens]|uniref:ImmA/IrrE family metallo-endopeptidase n=1 Tax=Bacillus amyloliquefaciens TaxID=1390 RepID=UPI000B4371BA|nr:ImmA/IrrE family metallo-endopeptidase [Bacillus amyloliquefaciens]TXK25997.1 ImmA/IrrE family metallo-endopeptidase [Bacillus amyloliquefaciens]TXK32573.1 ImmA/IrrE family metallo-endopeptidase [Bacillus amyloliquefaciens]WBY35456.1 ImmA/IrrE family metallo-endopeptidase [Bacillus amyloliquefaciens]WJM56503.1 ImmA/IrrE family metallo-endopeptidase [Bacillus amyloliquefaciens]
MKTMIYKADYIKAEKKAHELLNMYGVNELPIKVKKLSKKFLNLKIRTYSWYAKKWGLSIDEVCESVDSDEGCCWYIRSQKQYMILYNDTVENDGRKRWTIAHELGHFMLKHNEITGKAIFARSSLSDDEYDVFEKEANCFARCLLAPTPVLRELKPASPHFISDICKISYEASTHIYNFLTEGIRRGISYSRNHPSLQLFKNYIWHKKNTYWCSNCSYTFIKENPNFCYICGNSNITQGEGYTMIYSRIELTESHRAMKCPKCLNELAKGNYCHICGVYLINRCTGFEPGEVEYNYNSSRVYWHLHENGCGELLDGDARFCPQCGSTSTFFEDGILKNWDIEKKEQEEALENFLS